jgi:hypothetical protein
MGIFHVCDYVFHGSGAFAFSRMFSFPLKSGILDPMREPRQFMQGPIA